MTQYTEHPTPDEYRFILPTGQKVIFSPSQPKKVEVEVGMVLVSATVVTKDETKFDVLLLIDEHSSGKHWALFSAAKWGNCFSNRKTIPKKK